RGISVVYSRRSIPDRSCPSKELMREILDEIDGALGQGHRVYVHCWGGVGRTGTVVGCHLVRGGAKGKEALDRLAGLYGTVSRLKRHFNPRSPETEEQRAFIASWSEDG
ncbi:MAG: protein-tyrosine phosphatase family protein, partial [Gemmatimonadaceae bacterium]